jgi:YfiR/HmsC-like
MPPPRRKEMEAPCLRNSRSTKTQEIFSHPTRVPEVFRHAGFVFGERNGGIARKIVRVGVCPTGIERVGMKLTLQHSMSAIGMAAAMLTVMEGDARAEEAGEYEMKATFLCKFLEFVKWPAKPETPVVLGVLGDDPFGGTLERAVEAQKKARNPVTIRRSRRAEELRDCRIVFVSRSEKDRAREIIAVFAGTQVLTVSDSEEFLMSGAMIAFGSDKGAAGIKVNQAAAKRAGLTISSRLLKLAKSVPDPVAERQ